jgi:RNA polymerase sigma-70 factor, ECF subfamily
LGSASGGDALVLDSLRSLVVRCLKGDQYAMRSLVDHYQGRVFGLCWRMLGNRQDAEDATQETFIRVLQSLRRWDSSREFEPWLFAIAANRCRSALSIRKRRPCHQSILEHPVEENGPLDEDARHLAEEVAKGLQLLRWEYREAFVLFHEQGLCYEEIAEITQRPLGTVKTWIHRARRELMDYLVQRDVLPESDHVVRDV